MPETTITSADGTNLAARRSGHGSPMVLVHGANGDLDTFALIEGLLAERHSVGSTPAGARRQRRWARLRPRARGRRRGSRPRRRGRPPPPVRTFWRSGVLPPSSHAAAVLAFARTLRARPCTATAWTQASSTTYRRPWTPATRTAPSRSSSPWSASSNTEIQVLRSLEPVWERLRAGVRLVPREVRTGFEAIDRLEAFDPPDIPTLYLYGEATGPSIFATPDEVAELLPKAQLHGLPGQRHLAFAFDPTSVAQAVLHFTTAHEG
jgi:pimeloyl-ACP methyl ester carboxylesterase